MIMTRDSAARTSTFGRTMMRTMGCVRLSLCSAVLLAVTPLHATSWYVDNTAGSGQKTGASWSNAWTSLQSVNWQSIHAGDTLYISGGATSQTYTETWSVGASGTSGNPITIAVGQDAGHNGTVIFDYNADGDKSTRTAITVNRNYVTFNGNYGGANHIAVRNLRNIINRYSANSISGGGTGLTFDHLTFTNDNNPLSISNASGLIIRNCRFEQTRGDRAIFADTRGSWNANQIYGNYIEILSNTAVPPGGSGSYVGPDGIQGNDGMSIYNNTFKVITTTVYTSSQHPDMLQMQGSYLKIYGNDFVNVGDSVFDFDCYANHTPHDIWLYNNIFRIVTTIDPYPEFFRLYASSGSVQSITNIKILNNDFIDNTADYRMIRLDSFNGSPTGSGNEIKNNIFYNDGGGLPSDPLIYIENSTGFNASSWAFGSNVYYQPGKTQYIVFQNQTYTTANWVATKEPTGRSGVAPSFIRYSAFSDSNDYHLSASDTVARDKGVSLASYFTTDKDGATRPAGAAWDIGAYEAGGGTGGTTPPAAPTGLRAVPN